MGARVGVGEGTTERRETPIELPGLPHVHLSLRFRHSEGSRAEVVNLEAEHECPGQGHTGHSSPDLNRSSDLLLWLGDQERQAYSAVTEKCSLFVTVACVNVVAVGCSN